MGAMPTKPLADGPRDPLLQTRRLLVDGTNLLHAIARRPGGAPPAALVGRLRAVIPAATAIELVFDGPAERGLRNERIASGVRVRYAGHRSADALLLDLVDDVGRIDGPAGTNALLIVTDDRELRHGARLRGARTAGSAWLLGRLDAGRLAAPSVGNPRAPRPARPSPMSTGGDDEVDDRPGWRPGRGATSKKGNPRKAPRAGGTGRMPA
jgi:hypothetical protein